MVSLKAGLYKRESAKITVLRTRTHSKASESYVDVTFHYDEGDVDWSVPVEYRRTGTHFQDSSAAELLDYIFDVFDKCQPTKWKAWREEEKKFWSKCKKKITQPFFDELARDFRWCSVESDLPNNPNWARRIQDLKEFGYTLSTDTKRHDKRLGKNRTHILLIPLPRGGITGYEQWTPAVREKILEVLACYDAYEAKAGNKHSLLPDHKFPEVRWDISTKRESLSDLKESEIRRDFQLLSNQRNLQKREVCRTCYQTGLRGYPYGIEYYYHGDRQWPKGVPQRGKVAESGCKGCGWYDLDAWRRSLLGLLK